MTEPTIIQEPATNEHHRPPAGETPMRRGMKPGLARNPKTEVDAVAAKIDPYFLCYPARRSYRVARYKETRKKAADIIKTLDDFRAALGKKE